MLSRPRTLMLIQNVCAIGIHLVSAVMFSVLWSLLEARVSIRHAALPWMNPSNPPVMHARAPAWKFRVLPLHLFTFFPGFLQQVMRLGYPPHTYWFFSLMLSRALLRALCSTCNTSFYSPSVPWDSNWGGFQIELRKSGKIPTREYRHLLERR